VSTRWRIFLSAVLLIVVPLVGLSWVLRHRIAAQYEREFTHRATVQLDAAFSSLHRSGHRIAATLRGIAEAMRDDNQLRLAIVGDRQDLLPYLREAAGRAMQLGGLQVLQLQDADGTILSSGHYRNEFGRRDPALAPLLGSAAWPRPLPLTSNLALARMRLPEGEVLALVVLQPLVMARRTLHLIGGELVTGGSLADLAADQASLSLITASGPEAAAAWHQNRLPSVADWSNRELLAAELARAGYLVRAETVPLIAAGALNDATLMAHISADPLRRTLRELDLTLALALAAALGGAFGLAIWLSARLSRPLQDLARLAARVDLDDPAADLGNTRRDEVGQLSRVLATMVGRLREDARRLAEAEHRATLGDIARQVNHDLRNGLTPVRNVLRHLREAAAAQPAQLAAIFTDRQQTLDGSLAYLEELAGRYARLAPESNRRRCDLGAIAREAALGVPAATVAAAPDAPAILADPVALRRILDNLLRNSREALGAAGGAIAVAVARGEDPDLGPRCVLTVRDNGIGMSAEVLARISQDFFTTKTGGTGLGLSIVRRLAGDAGGRLHIESRPGAGTTVTVTFPAAESEA
jgi:signal transduction histidine kinase